MNTKYNNLADKTAADMMNGYIMCAYNTMKAVHPECGGFSVDVTEVDEGVRTKIQLLVPKEVSG